MEEKGAKNLRKQGENKIGEFIRNISIFQIFDERVTETVSFKNLVTALYLTGKAPPEERLNFLFKLHMPPVLMDWEVKNVSKEAKTEEVADAAADAEEFFECLTISKLRVHKKTAIIIFYKGEKSYQEKMDLDRFSVLWKTLYSFCKETNQEIYHALATVGELNIPKKNVETT